MTGQGEPDDPAAAESASEAPDDDEPRIPVAVIASVGTAAVMPRKKSRRLAGALALLVGGLGAHRFYVGQHRLGLVYLLLCWTGVPAFVALVDGISLLTMSDAAFRRRFPQTK